MKYYIFAFFLYINTSIIAQTVKLEQLYGRWQNKSSSVSAGSLDTYRFYSDGRFIFDLSEYDGSKRIIAIKGHYRLSCDTIFFKVEYTTELLDGEVVRDIENTEHGSWSIQGKVKVVDIKQPQSCESFAIIKICMDKSDVSCILLDRDKYFRINKNSD